MSPSPQETAVPPPEPSTSSGDRFTSPSSSLWHRFVALLVLPLRGLGALLRMPFTWLSHALLGAIDDDQQGAPPVPIRNIFKRFWPYLKPYRGWLVLALICIAIVPAIETASIWLFKVLVDQVLVPHDFARFPLIAGVYVALTLVESVVGFGDTYFSTLVSERFLLALRTDFFRHLQELSLDFFTHHQLGDTISRITNDISAIEDFMVSGLVSAISYSFRIVFFIGALFFLRWELALISLIIAPLFMLLTQHFSQMMKQVSRERRRRTGTISAEAEESLSAAMLIQANNRQDVALERFHHENERRYQAQMASARIQGIFDPVIDFTEMAAVLIVIGAGTWELTQGRLSLGGLFVFMAYLSQLYGPIRSLLGLANSAYSASASAERVIEYWDMRPAIDEQPVVFPPERARGVLAFENVSFRYPGAATETISHVSFRLRPGEIVGLVGLSGAGKSTIMRLLLRFCDPSDGVITLDGEDVRHLPITYVRDQLAAVLQETNLFDETIRENIAFGQLDADDQAIARATHLADADTFIEALPGGYDTIVGQRGQRLSGGQRQRIALARAFVREAPLMVLDEPTTGLDETSSRRIFERLRQTRFDRATLIITHHLSLVDDADEILVMEHGRVIERGTRTVLMAYDGRYAQLAQRGTPALEMPEGVPEIEGV